MNAVLIGYFPKRRVPVPDWVEVPHVEEICSVSDCVSDGPRGWMEQWEHNAYWAYDSAELAWSVVPAESRQEFEVHAWRIVPVRFTRRGEEPFAMPELTVESLPPGYVRLGFDAVSRTHDGPYGCSPLSCNHMAREFAVNRHCLVEAEADAFQVAREFGRTEPEPGPYYLIEVWRKAQAGCC